MSRSQFLGFRASEQFNDALQAAADGEGVSKSEFLRRAVEDRLARANKAEKVAEGFNPFAMLAPAARGSIQAQRDLANACVEAAFTRDDNGNPIADPVRCLIEGLVFARLAAAHGEIGDQGLVVSMIALLMQVVPEDADYSDDLAEAVARISQVADLGGKEGEMAADNLPWLVDASGPHVAAAAQRISDFMRA